MATPRCERSVLLLTPADAGIRESGSGFIIAAGASTTHVVTCAHVIRDWEGRICVNGHDAVVEIDGSKEGVDIAVLRVEAALGLPALRTKPFVKAGATVYAVSYKHLYGNDYVLSSVNMTAGRDLSIQTRGFGRTVPAWAVHMPDGDLLAPGNSGSPIVDASTDRVVGILSHANRDGRAGIALSALAIAMVWEPPPDASDSPNTGDVAFGIPAVRSPITVEDDPNKGRFGGAAERAGRRLSIAVTEESPDSFHFDAEIESTDGSALAGPGVFYLHDTYPRPRVVVRHPQTDRNIIALRDVYSYGVYTIGCQVRDRDGAWVSLELDLADVAAVPRRFLSR